MALEYSENSGAGFALITDGEVDDGAYDWTTPPIDCDTVRVRVRVTDELGAQGEATSTTDLTIDSASPVIQSFVVAEGATVVALPITPCQLMASDATAGPLLVRISTNPTFADDDWRDVASPLSVTLSAISGPKQVHAWVKDQVGHVSAPASDEVLLDYGPPPVVRILAPVPGTTITAGNVVRIDWSCASASALDALPVRLSYRFDDGTGDLIADWRANDDSATTGHFDWTVPASLPAVRLFAECRSASGVTANDYSTYFNTPGWDVFAGDPSDGQEGVSAQVAFVSIDDAANPEKSIAADRHGNVYFARGHAIMKVDALSGLVTRFAGSHDDRGCTLRAGNDPLDSASNGLGRPWVWGTDTTRGAIIFEACDAVWQLDTTSRALTALATVPTDRWTNFMSRTGRLYCVDQTDGRVGRYDLNVPASPYEPIFGDGTCADSVAPVGTPATQSPVLRGDAGHCPIETNVLVDRSETRVWIHQWNQWGNKNAIRLDWDEATGQFVIGSTDVGWGSPPYWEHAGGCTPSLASSRTFCSGRYDTGTRTSFDEETQTWTDEPLTGLRRFVGYGATTSGMVVIDSRNQLIAIEERPDGSRIDYDIGGQDVDTIGNGDDLSQVAFSGLSDLSFAPSASWLLTGSSVSTSFRRIDFGTVPIGVDTLGAQRGFHRLTASDDASRVLAVGEWCGLFWDTFNWNGSAFVAGSSLYNALGCNSGTPLLHPVADGTSGSYVDLPLPDRNARACAHSNGKFYFFVRNTPAANAIVYSSDLVELRTVAGTAGPVGYDPADDGSIARNATLQEVKLIREIPLGHANAGDLLVLDADRWRRIGVTTTPANPRIYDVLDLTLAAGYTAGTALQMKDFVYDFASELDDAGTPVLGSGTFYYVTSTNQVRRQKPTAVAGGTVTAAQDTAYDLTGTTFAADETPRLALTPAGLLVMQPSRNRILVVAP